MQLKSQAALLLEQPYGFFGTLNPTGHAAIYLARICAESPTTLRRCHPGELGSVISRYQGIDHYDWLAIPLVPYLYSVERAGEVPDTVNKPTVAQLRDQYHERHLLSLGKDVQSGNFFKGGWSELIGASYERRIYAYRFNTTEEQDDKLIAQMNAGPNHSRFSMLFNNCADFSRSILNFYIPGVFDRTLFPDAGLTTPKLITNKLLHYAQEHQELALEVFMIPQISGYRKHSRSNHGIAESLITSPYAIPIAVLNPYLAGGLFVDYLFRGRAHLVPKDTKLADAPHINELTGMEVKDENPTGAQAMSPPNEPAQKASP
jgi:hypothetical protein